MYRYHACVCHRPRSETTELRQRNVVESIVLYKHEEVDMGLAILWNRSRAPAERLPKEDMGLIPELLY